MPGRHRYPQPSLNFFLKDHSDLVVALLKISQSSLLADVTDIDRSVIKTMASELGTNMIKYARRGVLKVNRIDAAGTSHIEILAEDQGPGIPDLELAMTDRFSTGSSLGLGLPGVKRMADFFSITSSADAGTCVTVRKRVRSRSATQTGRPVDAMQGDPLFAFKAETFKNAQLELACRVRPAQGEIRSGDMATVIELPGGVLVALVDVSGHGFRASELAAEIHLVISRQASARIAELMSTLHDRLRGTLGAAISLMYLDMLNSTVHYCAVGNTAASRVVGKPWRPVSKDGVVGFRLQSLLVENAELSNGDVLMLVTDGVAERHGRQYVAENASLPCNLIAQGLLGKCGRSFDDAGCIILKWIA